MHLKGKKVGIIGLSRTGVASAKVLTELGAKVIVSDAKPAIKLKTELDMLKNVSSISFDLGGHSDKVLDADLLILSPGVPLNIPILIKARQKGIPIMSEVELSFRLSKAPFIAITGTNGKSTTTSLLGWLLKTYPYQVFVGGNIGRPLISEVLKLTEKDLVVAEVSSFQLEMVETFHPKIALFLNLTPDHLDRHKTLEAYLKAKMNIFKNQTEEDYIILNADDEQVSRLAPVIPSKILWFSRKKKVVPGCYLEKNKIICDLGNVFTEIIDVEELKIRGAHNVENAMAAILGALVVGIKVKDIRDGLKSFKGQEHTLEYVLTHNGVEYYNDSKGTNPDASLKALESFAQPIILIAGGLSRNLDFSQFIETVVKRVKTLILIGETKVIIKEKALEYGFKGEIFLVDDLKEAVYISKRCSEPGDVVLLSPACASWDMFESYVQRGVLFKKYVREVIDNL